MIRRLRTDHSNKSYNPLHNIQFSDLSPYTKEETGSGGPGNIIINIHGNDCPGSSHDSLPFRCVNMKRGISVLRIVHSVFKLILKPNPFPVEKSSGR